MLERVAEQIRIKQNEIDFGVGGKGSFDFTKKSTSNREKIIGSKKTK